MLGQSGLPMMNILAAAKDRGQEGILTPTPETVEGEFEKAFAKAGAQDAEVAILARTPAAAKDPGERAPVSPVATLPDQPEAATLLTDGGDPVDQVAPPIRNQRTPAPPTLTSRDKAPPAILASDARQTTRTDRPPAEPKSAGGPTDVSPTIAEAVQTSEADDLAPATKAEAISSPVINAIDKPPPDDRASQMTAEQRPQQFPKQAPNESAPTGSDQSMSRNAQTLRGGDVAPAPPASSPASASDAANGVPGPGVVGDTGRPSPVEAANLVQVVTTIEQATKSTVVQPIDLTSPSVKAGATVAQSMMASPVDGRDSAYLAPAQPVQSQTVEAANRLRNATATLAHGAAATGLSPQGQTLVEDQFDIRISAPAASAPALLSRSDPTVPVQSPPSVEPRAVMQQVAQAVVRMDGGRTEITLDPVELGRVSLTFVAREEGVSVIVTADRPETADLLRRNGDQLQRDLQNAGYDDIDLGFEQGRDDSDGYQAAQPAKGAATAQAADVTYGASWSEAGLDIRI